MQERSELAKVKLREKTWNLLTNPFSLVTNAQGSTIPRNVDKYLMLRRYLFLGDVLDQTYLTKVERKVITVEVLKEYEEQQPRLDEYLTKVAEVASIHLTSEDTNTQAYYTSFLLPAIIDEFNYYLTKEYKPHNIPEDASYSRIGYLAHSYVKTHCKEHFDDLMAELDQTVKRHELLTRQIDTLKALAYEFNKNYVDVI